MKDVSAYYVYIFVYVDDILILDVVSLEKSYTVKKGSIEEPKN